EEEVHGPARTAGASAAAPVNSGLSTVDCRLCYERPVLAGVSLALLTSVSWALGNVFIQKSGRAVGGPRAMRWALSAGAALAGAVSAMRDVRPAAFDAATGAWTAAAVVGCLFAYICLFYAFEKAPLSLAVSLVSSWSLISGGL